MVDPKEHWASKAEILKNAGKFEEAIKILDKVQKIEKEEKDDDFWNKKAQQYCEIGEYEQAKNALEKDLEINQKSYETFFLFGKVLYELKKYEEALECINKAAEEFNSQHLKNTQKIDRMKNVRKFEEAIKYSDMVYQEKNMENNFWHQKGMVLFKLKKYGEASSCFEIILKTDQRNSTIQYELAKSELWAGNKQKSLEILEKACILNPQIKEKLRIDNDFESLAEEKKFQTIVGLLN